jgi:DNA-binding LytR/AlgR family response regulator
MDEWTDPAVGVTVMRVMRPAKARPLMTFYAAQDGIQPEAFEHEWQAAQRAQEMAGNGKPATYWEESET